MQHLKDTGETIDRIRKKEGLTWEEISKNIGITIPTYWRMINGGQVSLKTAKKTIHYLKPYGFSLVNFGYGK